MAPPPPHLTDLALARTGLDRRADLRAREDLLAALLSDGTTRVLELVADTAPVLEDARGVRLALRPPRPGDDPRSALFLGTAVGERAADPGGSGMPSRPAGAGRAQPEAAAYVALVRDDEGDATGDGVAARAEDLRTLRQVGAHLGDRDAEVFTTALALANWHRTHRFCPRCGRPTVAAMSGWVRRCVADDSQHFPRTDPAVIMSVVDDADRLLLARNRGFRGNGASVLAGFVEPGESLSAAVVREVAEEVGVAVADVTYLGDQPWPFPGSLMVGFTCRALGTDLALQDDEIAAARWFTRDQLVAAIRDEELRIPPRLSIARRLVEHWYGGAIDAPEVILRGR